MKIRNLALVVVSMLGQLSSHAVVLSGYTASGPYAQVLPWGPPREMCTVALPEHPDARRCSAAGGNAAYGPRCTVVCDTPFARQGFEAGFDFEGYQIAAIPREPIMCPMWLTKERVACERAGGRAAAGCSVLCTVPIAQDGQVAGFLLPRGTSVVFAEKVQSCGFAVDNVSVLDDDEVACRLAGGTTTPVSGCSRAVCNRPVARPLTLH